MKPPHKHFFSSLKQVEKRLKLDDGNPPPPSPPPPSPPPPPPPSPPPESSTGSPIYFHNHHTTTSSTPNDTSIEQPPHEFLSISDFQSNPNNQSNDSDNNSSDNSTVGDVESMIQLLRLSDFDLKVSEMCDLPDDEFYEKIVKVKGPKCRKEVERLDKWIEYLLNKNNNNGGFEPLRLAHLLLAKAAVVGGGDGGDGDGVEFPATVDEFLQNDPPSD